MAWFRTIDRKKKVVTCHLYGHATYARPADSCFMSVELGAVFSFGGIAQPISRAHLCAYRSSLVTRPAHVQLGISDILFGTVAMSTPCHLTLVYLDACSLPGRGF